MTCLNWGPDNWSFSGSLAGQTTWEGNTLVVAGPITVDTWEGTQSGAPELLLRPINVDQTQEIVLSRVIAQAYVSNDDFSSFIDWALQWRWDTPPAVPGFDDASGWNSTAGDNTVWGTILSIFGGTSPLGADKTYDSDMTTTALDGNETLSVVNSDWRLRLMPAGIGLGSNQALRISDLQLTAVHTCGGAGPVEPEPPTPEQIFRVAYADVSGRDALPTALSQRTPAKNLVNYNIKQHLYNPQIVQKPELIQLGELNSLVLGSEHWFDADPRDPLFSMGRWAQVLGKSGTGDTGDPVVLKLRICDNPESFIPPP